MNKEKRNSFRMEMLGKLEEKWVSIQPLFWRFEQWKISL